jgi:hypothetical protein
MVSRVGLRARVAVGSGEDKARQRQDGDGRSDSGTMHGPLAHVTGGKLELCLSI